MITYSDKDGLFKLPTGWHEVTTAQFCELHRLALPTVEDRAGYFAGRPVQVNGILADTLAFILPMAPPTEGGLACPQDLGQETYLQVESIRALLVAQSPYECFGQVYSIFQAGSNWLTAEKGYSQQRANAIAERVPALPITDTYPAVVHCLKELARLGEKYAALAEPDRTEAGEKARAAGSERLQLFGHYNVALAYAKELGVTLDAAYQTPWETVAVWLLHQRTQAEINDQLHQNSKNQK